MLSLYRNPDLDDPIFDCLLILMAAVQAEDMRPSFLFLADLNGYHQEWLGSAATNRHGVTAIDFATVSGCDQLVVGPTHARGGILDLLMTDVPDLVRVAVVEPKGNSDHSYLSAVRKHVTKYKNMRKWMVEFLRKSENRGDKIAQVNSNRINKSINLL